ncbi:MAG: hypothetical protein PF436_04720 [Prolixibacteraceae bacterium]|jgi:hypothetical protein|nr:hypothetical protein [Prolixibacteraceae bacterium]
MKIVTGIKDFGTLIKMMEVSSTNLSDENFNAGNILNVNTSDTSASFEVLVSEVKHDKMKVIVPPKSINRVKNVAIGERFNVENILSADTFACCKGNNVICLAENASSALLIPHLKNLRRAGKNVLVILVTGNDESADLYKSIAKIEPNTQSVAIDRHDVINNSIAKILYENIEAFNANMLYVFGNELTVKEAFHFVSGKPLLNHSVILDRFTLDYDRLPGLYSVSINRRSKYLTIEGNNYYAIYRSFEDFTQRFSDKSKSVSDSVGVHAI